MKWLLLVLALIAGLVVAVMLPAVQEDMQRKQVQAALAAAKRLAPQLAAYREIHQRWPATLTEAGLEGGFYDAEHGQSGVLQWHASRAELSAQFDDIKGAAVYYRAVSGSESGMLWRCSQRGLPERASHWHLDCESLGR
ncbi:hypothetical protein [Chitinolyticbacter meiyuanensis]|uniref:hypothetical protein n=1 Tax=Chitinolyticbacter meiyuanensis TaxID=682798 RepID=UPI0011E5A610|nr:hypothetical protein [Chitinolyticbacter meiyuanensis]